VLHLAIDYVTISAMVSISVTSYQILWLVRPHPDQEPLHNATLTSLLIYFVGDQLAQGVGGEPYHGKRTLRNITIGAIIRKPLQLLLQDSLISTRVVVSQVLFSPGLIIYFFGM
jgi:hypothetical protein